MWYTTDEAEKHCCPFMPQHHIVCPEDGCKRLVFGCCIADRCLMWRLDKELSLGFCGLAGEPEKDGV